MRALIPRLCSRLRHAATRATGAACYGAVLLLGGFYGLVSYAVLTLVAVAVAAGCLFWGKEGDENDVEEGAGLERAVPPGVRGVPRGAREVDVPCGNGLRE